MIEKEKVKEWYWNAFFYYFLIWKLSYILFHFNLFIRNPLSSLYFNGGVKGHFLALIIISFYLLFFSGKKYSFKNREVEKLLLFFIFSYQVVINIFEKNTIELFLHTVLLAGFLCLLFYLKKKTLLFSAQMFVLMMMIELLIWSFLHSIFSVLAVTFVLLSIIALLLSRLVKV